MGRINLFRPGHLLLIASILGACQSADPPAPALEVVSLTNTTLTPTLVEQAYRPAPPTKVLPEYVFDWENAAYLPGPAGSTRIPMPWSANVARAFSEDIRADYKRADGWELLYNTSGTQAVPAHRLLLLYNRFRGLLRCYYYLAGNVQTIAGNNITAYQLSVDGNSSLMNYEAQAVTDVETNSRTVSVIEPQAIQQGAWYAFQNIIAYDPTLAQQRADKLTIHYEFNSDQLTQLSVGGRPTSQVSGRFILDGTDATRLLTTLTTNGRFVAYGPHDVARRQISGLPVDWLSQYLSEPADYRLLNGILVDSGRAGSSVIEWNEAVRLTKPLGRSAGLVAPAFALPGYDNSQTKGITPQFNETPGVFYLAARPQIRTQTTSNNGRPAYVYTLDVPSVRYLFNPALANSASIEQIKQEIIATAPDNATDAQPTYYTGTTLTANQPLSVIGVRVSFTVVPKNGSAPIRLVKTFKANLAAS